MPFPVPPPIPPLAQICGTTSEGLIANCAGGAPGTTVPGVSSFARTDTAGRIHSHVFDFNSSLSNGIALSDGDAPYLTTGGPTSTTGSLFLGHGANTITTGTPLPVANTAVGDGALSVSRNRQNTAVGTSALSKNDLGFGNTAVGAFGLTTSVNGVLNTAVGSNALAANGDSTFNTAVGGSALVGNTTGIENTAVGVGSLAGNTGGSDNTALGVFTLETTTGNENLACGRFALTTNTGSRNVALGSLTLIDNSADFNTAVGAQSMSHLIVPATVTGRLNTVVGAAAGITVTSGANNVIVGAQADVDSGDRARSIVLGSNAVTLPNAINLSDLSPNNQLVIGDTAFESARVGTGAVVPTTFLLLTIGANEYKIPMERVVLPPVAMSASRSSAPLLSTTVSSQSLPVSKLAAKLSLPVSTPSLTEPKPKLVKS